jgi:FkbM family methyltransferase
MGASIAMNKTIVVAMTALARRLGYTVIPTWRMDQLPLESHLRKVFGRYSIDTVLDIGANAGQYGDFLRQRVGFDGVIHSFEPVSSFADKIARKSQTDARWHVHRCGLGSQETTLEINVTSSDVFSSFLEPDVDRNPEFERHMTLVRKEFVPVKRLDNVWRDLAISDAGKTYLKIDTQGFDLEVLRGAAEVLPAIRALQFELSMQPIYKGTPTYLQMLSQLEDWGFAVSGFFPITTSKNLQVVEFDCVMLARNS